MADQNKIASSFDTLCPVLKDFPVNYDHPKLAEIRDNPHSTEHLNDFDLMEEILFKDESLRSDPDRWLRFGCGERYDEDGYDDSLTLLEKDVHYGSQWYFIAPFHPSGNLFLMQVNHYAMWNTIATISNKLKPEGVLDYEASKAFSFSVMAGVANNCFACTWAFMSTRVSTEYHFGHMCPLCPIWGTIYDKTQEYYVPCVDCKNTDDNYYEVYQMWAGHGVDEEGRTYFAQKLAIIPWKLTDEIKNADFMHYDY